MGPVEQMQIDDTIIDTDVHLQISSDQLAPYLDEPHKGHAQRTAFPTSGWDRRMGKIGRLSAESPSDIQEYLCEGLHVDIPILNTFSQLHKLSQTDLSLALMRGYNDYLLDVFLDDNDHFLGLATIETSRPDRAAEEIDRVGAESQIVGVYIATTGAYPPLGDPSYDVVYRAAADNDVTIVYHGDAGGFPFEFPRQNRGLETFLSVHTLAHTWSQMLTLTSLIVQGTPEKFPDLSFVFLEAGISWVPYMMFRLNKEYSFRRSEAPLLTKTPEEYVRDRCYFSTQPIGEPNDPQHIQQVIDIVGDDMLVFSTDYPHWDFDHPSEIIQYLIGSDSSDQREKLLSGNAKKAFNLRSNQL